MVAVMVTVSPFDPTSADTAGVVSLVRLSVLDAPVSDDASRSGAGGAVGLSRSIVMFVAGLESDCSPLVLVRSAVTDHVPVVRSGRVQDVAVPMT